MPDGKARRYTTVLSTLQQMEAKGHVERDGTDGRAIVYRPTTARRRVLGPVLKRLVQRAFGGRPADVVQHLVEDGGPIAPAELRRMRDLIDAAERRQTTDETGGNR